MGGAASRPIQKGSEMRWTRPHHGRWLAACLVAFLLSGSFGGFNASIAMVFLVIFVVGAVLLSPGDAEGDLEGDAEIEGSGEDDTESEVVVDQQNLQADESTADADAPSDHQSRPAGTPDPI